MTSKSEVSSKPRRMEDLHVSLPQILNSTIRQDGIAVGRLSPLCEHEVARIESARRTIGGSTLRVVSRSPASGQFWQYDANGKREADLWVATRYMSAPVPCRWSAATVRTWQGAPHPPAPCWTASTREAHQGPPRRGRLGSRTKNSPTNAWASPRPTSRRESRPRASAPASWTPVGRNASASTAQG
jgi:hypothetical protein